MSAPIQKRDQREYPARHTGTLLYRRLIPSEITRPQVGDLRQTPMVKKVKKDPRSASSVDRQIGARIRARRLEISMSQVTLAENTGVTFQQIQKYEKGVNRVAASTLIDIASALEVRAQALLPSGGKGGAGDVTALDDPEVQQMAHNFARLNEEGRRVLAGIVRSLLADDKLRAKGPR